MWQGVASRGQCSCTAEWVMVGKHLHNYRCVCGFSHVHLEVLGINVITVLPNHSFLYNAAVPFNALTPRVIRVL